MAKVTVYVTDDQLDKLKAVKGVGRGGVSKLFQAFLDSATTEGEPTGRYDYARKLMPTHAAIERHRRRLARSVQTGGPPADGGPVSVALTILLYRRLLASDPDLAATFEKEFARFGLDELVDSETEGVDLLAEPDEDEFEADAEADFGGFASFGQLGLRIGDEVREAVRQVQILKDGLRDIVDVGEVPEQMIGRRSGPRHRQGRERGERGERGRGRRRLVVEVSADDDPRDVLSVNDFATFMARHADWDAGARLTPSQMETVRELLIRRAGGDPVAEDDNVEIEVDVETSDENSDEPSEGEAGE